MKTTKESHRSPIGSKGLGARWASISSSNRLRLLSTQPRSEDDLEVGRQFKSVQTLVHRVCKTSELESRAKANELLEEIASNSQSVEPTSSPVTRSEEAAIEVPGSVTPANGTEAVEVVVRETPSAQTTTSESGLDANDDTAGPIYSSLPADDMQFQAIVADFAERLRDEVRQMKQDLLKRNYKSLASRAHWLKGSGGTLGFDVFSVPARELEAAAKAEDQSAVTRHVNDISGYASRVTVDRQADRSETVVTTIGDR